MLPFQPNDELVFPTPTSSDDRSSMEGNMINFSSGSNDKKLAETPSSRSGKRRTKRGGETDIRKVIMHRDVERKRREEMSNLYADLHSCLPIEHTKGKRTIGDDIEKAADYIKLMQKNIQQLSVRRDNLKQASNSSGSVCESSDNLADDCVMVNQTQDGLEILISQRVGSCEFEISWILAELEQRELNVVSCDSTCNKGGFLHKIQIQARDMTSDLDVTELQDRLTKCLQVNE